MIEVLIAVVVLSFGMLGVVGLQAAALQANKEARYQSGAARLARELGDLVRGNAAVAQGTTSGANPYLVDTTVTQLLPPAVTDCFAVSTCSSANQAGQYQIGQYQLVEWYQRVNAELPGARVMVCIDSNAGALQWSCAGSGAGLLVVKIGWTRQSLNRGATGSAAVERAFDSTSTPAVVFPLLP